eukprot:88921_1
MGNFDSRYHNTTTNPPQPVPPNAILIDQALSWQKCHWSCQGAETPHWSYHPPNDLLIQNGLTVDQLQHEIQTLNKKAEQYVINADNYDNLGINIQYHWFGLLSLALVAFGLLILAILAFDESDGNSYGGWILFWIAVIVASIIFRYVRKQHLRIWHECLTEIQGYINNDVIPRYQEIGILWTIRSRSLRHGDGRWMFNVKYNDFCIQSNNTAAVQEEVQQVQQEHVIYVDQNGVQAQQPYVYVYQEPNQPQQQVEYPAQHAQIQQQVPSAPPPYQPVQKENSPYTLQ